MMSGSVARAASEIATAEGLLAAWDIGPCELVRGELVMMSPAELEHGVIAQRIAAFLHAYVSARRLGVVTAAETGFVLSRSPDTVRAPDVAFVSASRLPRGSATGFFEGAPDLAIEVLSPSDTRDQAARSRAAAKIGDWLAAGCQEVWCVDPASRTVTVHTASGVATGAGAADSFASQAVQGLAVRLADLLAPPDQEQKPRRSPIV
jgi:Uma2 family endonuclease